MTVTTATGFDVDVFRSAYETWDVERLLACYADDVELVQIDRDHPPSSPRVRRGTEALRGMFEHCAGAGVRATVRNTVAGEERAAATVICDFPGGRRVLANVILDIQDGRVVREHEVLLGDPKGGE